MDFVGDLNPAPPRPGFASRHEVEVNVAGDLSVSGDYDGAVSRTDPTSGTPSSCDNSLW